MKQIFFLSLSILILLSSCKKNNDVPSNPSASDSLKLGLIAYYPFNGNTNDESGNQYHLSVQAAVPDTDRFGNAGRAYYFNGLTSRMYIPDLIKADTLREMTISFWLKQEAQGGVVLSFLPVSKGPIGSNYVSVSSADSNLYWLDAAFLTQNDSFQITFSGAPAYFGRPANQWTHYVLVQRYNTQYTHPVYTYTHYQDAVKFGLQEPASQDNPTSISLSHGGTIGSYGEWQFAQAVAYSQFFKGDIDDIRIYNRALSDGEVKALYELNK